MGPLWSKGHSNWVLPSRTCWAKCRLWWPAGAILGLSTQCLLWGGESLSHSLVLAWPYNLTVSPHSFRTLALGVVDEWRIFQRSKHIFVFSWSVCNAASLEKKRPSEGMLTPAKDFGSWLHVFVACPRPPTCKWLHFLTFVFVLDRRSTRSEALTGANTVPTSCGGSSPRGSDAQVDTSFIFFHFYKVPPCWAGGHLSRAGK